MGGRPLTVNVSDMVPSANGRACTERCPPPTLSRTPALRRAQPAPVWPPSRGSWPASDAAQQREAGGRSAGARPAPPRARR
eukprot:scaffold7402_cov296-Prasinococcus_capsulatus_cf.AAC.1